MKTALIIGAGGLGCPVALSLAEGGVDHLVLVDPDEVSLSNLHRQLLYTNDDVGLSKVEVAKSRLESRVPGLEVSAVPERFSSVNAERLLGGVDVVIDATDDPAVRFEINDRAFVQNIPVVFGGILAFRGLVLAVSGEHGPCFRCLFEEPPAPEEAATCGQAGVLGALAGFVGHLQAIRALGILAGDVAQHTGFVTTIDALEGRIREVPLPEATDCPVCGGLAGRLDITPYQCPMTYVRTKLALENIAEGALLDVVMRQGEPALNIPRSLTEEGHDVLSVGALGSEHYRVVVRRGAAILN